jgi:hypothetical protein
MTPQAAGINPKRLKMETNPYAAPQADLALPTEIGATLYVVSTKKFWVLLIATLGLYQIYWFYRNWKLYKDHTGSHIWPIPRAIFNVFFMYSLNTVVNQRIKRQQLTHSWSPGYCALIFIVFAVIGNVCDRLSMREIGSPITDILGPIVMPIWGWALWQTQMAINVACKDIEGESNSAFTAANYVWITIGALFWILILFSLYLIFTGKTAA